MICAIALAKSYPGALFRARLACPDTLNTEAQCDLRLDPSALTVVGDELLVVRCAPWNGT
jgi:hypothetical protein